MAEDLKVTAGEAQRVDPEPFALFLTILGATGSVASLLALFQPAMQSSKEKRKDQVHSIRNAIMAAEVAMNDLRAHVQSLQIMFAVGAHVLLAEQLPAAAPASFGQVSLLLTREGYSQWIDLERRVLDATGRLQTAVNEIMRLFATSNLQLDDLTARYVFAGIKQLNDLVFALGQVPFQEAFERLHTAVAQCGTAMGYLRGNLEKILS